MKLPAIARRASWNLTDQVISSLTNAVLSFLVARSVDAESFGGFAIAFTVFALVLGGSRSLSTSPLNIRFSDASREESSRAAASATGTAFVLGLAIGAGSVVAGLFFSGSLGHALIALGIVLPALTVQDAYRFVFFARGKPAAAALNDAFWAVVQLGAVAGLLVLGMDAVGPLILAWGVSAAAASLLAVRQALSWPAPRRAMSWLREHRDLTGYLFASFATAHGCNQGAMLVIATVGSVEAVGSLRGAQILLGPTTILASAAFTFAVPEFARRRSKLSQRQWILAAAGVSAFVAGLGFLWGSIFLLAPDAVGSYLLDDTWAGTSAVLLAAVIGQVGAAASVGPVVMLYALDRASSTLTIQAVLGSLTFVGGVGGVLLGGALGAQWGLGLAAWVVVPFWFYRLRRELIKRASEAPEPEPSAEETVRMAISRPALSNRFPDDLCTAQMATILLPRVAPAPGAGSTGSRTPWGSPGRQALAPAANRPPAPTGQPTGVRPAMPAVPIPSRPRPVPPVPGAPVPGPSVPGPSVPGSSDPGTPASRCTPGPPPVQGPFLPRALPPRRPLPGPRLAQGHQPPPGWQPPPRYPVAPMRPPAAPPWPRQELERPRLDGQGPADQGPTDQDPTDQDPTDQDPTDQGPTDQGPTGQGPDNKHPDRRHGPHLGSAGSADPVHRSPQATPRGRPRPGRESEATEQPDSGGPEPDGHPADESQPTREERRTPQPFPRTVAPRR